jgi:hypothetical protein
MKNKTTSPKWRKLGKQGGGLYLQTHYKIFGRSRMNLEIVLNVF